MFEGMVGPGGWVEPDPCAFAVSYASPVDEPELTDAEWDAMVEALITADPAGQPSPSVGEVVALGESAPVSPALIAQLWAIDPQALDEDLAVGYTVAMQRVANAASARVGLGVNRTVAVSPVSAQVPRELHAAGQLGAALGLGDGGTDALVTAATQLAAVLPGAQAMALAGNLSWRKASSLAMATVGMTDENARRVEEKVLGKSWDRSPARHDAAVRRAVDQVDPAHADRKRRERDRDIRLVRHHLGAGHGELFARMPTEDLDLLWTAADGYARRHKAAGDPRPLDELRVAFLAQAARSYLSHGDPGYCARVCDPLPDAPLSDLDDPGGWPEPPTDDYDDDPHDDGPEDVGGPDDNGPGEDRGPDGDAPAGGAATEPPSPPTRHGRPLALAVVWDLTSLLGLSDHCALLRDSGALIPPAAVRDLLTGGARVRRMVIDPDTGTQLDLTPVTWLLASADGRTHRQPVELTVTTTARFDDLPTDVRAAIDTCDPVLATVLRELLDYPLTADTLDTQPDAESPSPALAEFTAGRAAHPVNPNAGPSPASAGDLDHHTARRTGGQTIRLNLGPLTRRWHRLKTFSNWMVSQDSSGWKWSSPTGRTYTIEPFDYRLGP